ncbi:helix-turn-helix transcriptional regulator [Actinomadura viridis]|uniref:Transcriptional regulator with XRE-family HTH domain n=1 Tax=Actinomadura viridis TaxID=58110 RepID=A0A931DJ36_9ACTN|nr:helix-turn-helix transcriptional regulator [Actinomadura viridis]MBG6088501.1 transcriptional regulator with XRE-family HTH domain [Actinomadura viridis]
MSKAPPSTARLRKIGRTLRRIRVDAGYTLKTAGRMIERSGSSLSLIEKGEQQLRLRDLKHILDVYEVEPVTHRALMTLAAQQQQHCGLEEFRETVSREALDIASLENSASMIALAEIGVIPGLMQTESYARSVIRAGLVGEEATKADGYLAFRLARQQRTLHRPDAPRLRIIVDEAALRRVRGGRRVMHDQLTHLLENSHRENVTLQVLPFECETDPTYVGPFQILEIGCPAILSAVLIDHLTGRWILEEDSDVTFYLSKFAHISKTALNDADSRTMLQRILSDL